jgi:hypothetical protein
MQSRATIISKLPTAKGNTIIVEENQSVRDIMATIVYMHKKNEQFYDRICSSFLGPTLIDTCENLWDFCKQNIPYEVETEDLQTVKSPQRILSGSGDCKHYASFIGGCLDGLRRKGQPIAWVYRFAGYKLFDSTPGHVFVVVKTRGKELWIDPVLDSFNEKKKYNFAIDKSVQSSLGRVGCACDSVSGKALVSGTIGADNKTAATLETVGGTICAVGGTIAACIPAGTVVAAVIEIVGFATSFIGKLFQSKYAYTSQVDWLCVFYQRLVLGDPNAKGNHITTGLKEQYVPSAQLWFATVLGVPCWDMLRYHALRGTDPNSDANLNKTTDEKIAAYQAFGSIEASVPQSALVTAVSIAATLDDTVGVGGWANFPPANIVLQAEGLTSEQVVQQAEGVLTGAAPNSLPTTTVYTSLGGAYTIPLLIGGAALLLIATNKNKS